MDLIEFRKLAMSALFADDDFIGHIVLKGANVLSILYKIGHRSSLDIDASLQNDFPWSDQETEQKLINSFSRVFKNKQLEVFDAKLTRRPRIKNNKFSEKFSGYVFEFKIIEQNKSNKFTDKSLRKGAEALVIGPNQERIYRIDFSTHEYIPSSVEQEVNGYVVYAYSPELIGIEKIRAICQQLPNYHGRRRSTPRSRDFFDIYQIATLLRVNFLDTKNLELIKPVFEAKEVPLEYLTLIKDTYDFHIQDFNALKATVPANIDIKEFRFYFDYLINLVNKIYTSIFTPTPLDNKPST